MYENVIARDEWSSSSENENQPKSLQVFKKLKVISFCLSYLRFSGTSTSSGAWNIIIIDFSRQRKCLELII